MIDRQAVQVSDASLEALGFPEVLSLVAALASTDVGGDRVRALAPIAGPALRLRRGALAELEGLLADGSLVGSLGEPIAELAEDLAGTRPELGGRQLLSWARVLETARSAVERIGGERPRLRELLGEVPDLAWLEDRIDATLDRHGAVRDDASPELARLRSRIGHIRKATYGHLHDLLAERAELFAEDTTPLHNGRLVLMLRAGERSRVEGLVHGRSASGRSLYFEPLAAVESNNELQEAVADEAAERNRLLRELADEVVGARQEIAVMVDALAELDALQAASRFGELTRGRLIELSEGDLSLVGARHPLLAPETRELRRSVLGTAGHAGDVTPLDVELVGDDIVLVLTGPNAGGKTVALKTVGLAVLMTLCGLPVPVDAGSRAPEVDTLVGVVGDEQDLLHDRSTFSGRLQRLREAWEAAGPAALVLLDELGSGTDPEEGAALSIALLERLVDRRARSLITTHLVAMAAAASGLAGAVTASMEFDRTSGLPTFRLLPGPPGGSEAIALARQLELPEAWLERAESLVGEEHTRMRGLLAEVDALRADLERQRGDLARLRQEAAIERQTIAAQRRGLEEDRRRLGARVRRELESFRQRVRERMDEEIEAARRDASSASGSQVSRRAVARLFADAPVIEGPDDEPGVEPIREGQRVRHVDYSWTGAVEKVEGERATVIIEGKRMTTEAAKLRPVDTAAEPPAQRDPRVEVARDDSEVPLALHLVGRRVDDALEELDRYLDRALLVPLTEVRIVHGHGSGRLRRSVREFLASHRAVALARPGESHEGGDGATVVRLRS
jgi:DNA mismatch repair protein MutS2